MFQLAKTERFSVLNLVSSPWFDVNHVDTSISIRCFGPNNCPLVGRDGSEVDFLISVANVAPTMSIESLRDTLTPKSGSSLFDWRLDVGEHLAVTMLRNALTLITSAGSLIDPPFLSADEALCEYWDLLSSSVGFDRDDYAKMMRVTEISSNIYHIEFGCQITAASTMLRYQERYECPSDLFRGHAFSLADYKLWAHEIHDHGFTYYELWPAFNVPGRIVADVLVDDLSDLHPREEALAIVLRPALDRYTSHQEPFYLVATSRRSTRSCLAHELAHALYELDTSYRDEINDILLSIPSAMFTEMCAYLEERGYARVDRILRDEVHAYLLDANPFGKLGFANTQPFHCRVLNAFLRAAGEFGRVAYFGQEDPSDDEN